MQPHCLIVGFGRTWWAQSSMAENQFPLNHKMDADVPCSKCIPTKRQYLKAFLQYLVLGENGYPANHLWKIWVI
jgi:hypothetical protein